MQKQFNFDQKYLEIQKKIEELQRLSRQADFDLDGQLADLEERMSVIREEKFQSLTPWEKVLLSRHPDRPSPRDLIGMIFDDWLELHGDRCYGDDRALIGGLAMFEGRPVTVFGHQKGRNTSEKVRNNFGMPHPEGYRKVQRLLAGAEKFGRSIITFIDTQGAYPGVGAEERGQAQAIAEVLMKMSAVRVPVLAVVTGEGGSGGALALAVSDRLLMLSNAVFSVASPEAAASILFKDQKRVEAMAGALKLSAQDLLELGIADEIIPEPVGGAHQDIQASAGAVKECLSRHLGQLTSMPAPQMLDQRYRRLRGMGIFAE